jgi:hypothetical protein
MAPDDTNYLGDPIPFDSEASTPAPVHKPAHEADDLFKPVGAPKAGPEPIGRTPAIGGGSSPLVKAAEKLNRPLNKTGEGATRVRTFHAKMNDGAMAFLDQQINEWLDGHTDYEVKFTTTTVGVLEGKRGVEHHLIINVWY